MTNLLRTGLLIAFTLVSASSYAASLTATEQAQIYSVVLQRLLGPDDTYDEPIPPGKVYIDVRLGAPPSPEVMAGFVSTFNKLEEYDKHPKSTLLPPPPPPPPPIGQGYPGDSAPPPTVMSPKTEAAIKSMLKLPKYDIHWMVVTQNTLGKQLKGKDKETGTILTVSQIGFLTDGRAYVEGYIEVISGGAGWTWYVFKKNNASWHLSKVIPGPVN